MDPALLVHGAVFALILARVAAEIGLEVLNQRHVRRHAATVPESLRATVDAPTYARSIEYTLARSRLAMVAAVYDATLLLGILGARLVPWSWDWWSRSLPAGLWSEAGFLFLLGMSLAVADLPLAWYGQFRVEARFGFNTTTLGVWCTDRIKGLLLAFLLGVPAAVLVLWMVESAGPLWWLWAWMAIMACQLALALAAPVVILPLFNRFTPLPDGSLRDRLLALARRTAFAAKSIQVMDGSRRSRHANAFFTGFGRFRKVVLFDTLIAQLTEPELEAVLAHEIGHFRRRHLWKGLAAASLTMLAGFAAVAGLIEQPWFFQAFGLPGPRRAVMALAVCGLLGGVVTFWLAPIANRWSRAFEYEADAFAANVTGDPRWLVDALRKLSRANLSNLVPHALYSGFHYSHPTLLEREQALAGNLHRQRPSAS